MSWIRRFFLGGSFVSPLLSPDGAGRSGDTIVACASPSTLCAGVGGPARFLVEGAGLVAEELGVSDVARPTLGMAKVASLDARRGEWCIGGTSSKTMMVQYPSREDSIRQWPSEVL